MAIALTAEGGYKIFDCMGVDCGDVLGGDGVCAYCGTPSYRGYLVCATGKFMCRKCFSTRKHDIERTPKVKQFEAWRFETWKQKFKDAGAYAEQWGQKPKRGTHRACVYNAETVVCQPSIQPDKKEFPVVILHETERGHAIAIAGSLGEFERAVDELCVVGWYSVVDVAQQYWAPAVPDNATDTQHD